ncbi:flagellar motor switch phosphatase FliY [Evansella tamaricis]|uniref:Flagellar motor switch phosphatase FliY n=1 Tax=Evansella tamaricis TaxID=2069301 RepID=A0ABS6JLY4_9BACI|nr:flagellar motor switch phosphatase FliY [Evansella tamaricis]MBU9714543.1 flagellar motor switch phosphatase FliY [Evansella tamaricis]
MSDDMLSQEEINALLNGFSMDDEESNDNKALLTENYLSSIETDAIGEIGNISFGSAATALSTLLNQKVDITTPKVSIVKKDELHLEFPKPHVAISVEYTSGFQGMNLLVIKTKDAAVIADLMLGNDGTNVNENLGEMEISAVQEAMNQMMGSASTSMSTIFNKRVDISPPGIDVLNLQNSPEHHFFSEEEDVIVNISFNLRVGDIIDSKIMQLIPVNFCKKLVEQLMNPEGNSDSIQLKEDENEKQGVKKENVPPEEMEVIGDMSDNHMYLDNRNNRNDRAEVNQHLTSSPRQPVRSANVQPAAFASFNPTSLGETETKNLEMLLDIPLEVTVELGRTKRSIKEILELAQGSIIELDKLAGEPVDILVNHRLIAKGEVVVIDENFGVRVTDIVSKTERIRKL